MTWFFGVVLRLNSLKKCWSWIFEIRLQNFFISHKLWNYNISINVKIFKSLPIKLKISMLLRRAPSMNIWKFEILAQSIYKFITDLTSKKFSLADNTLNVESSKLNDALYCSLVHFVGIFSFFSTSWNHKRIVKVD